MFSNLVSFEQVIEGIKDYTGIENLRNHYPKIRRFIYRIERDIGFGSTLVLKKVKFTLNNTNQIKLPDDIISIETIGTCSNGLCPGDYNIQGNYLFICKKNVTEFNLVYYSLLCDGSGNPVITENHFEAVVAGCMFRLYQPKIFNGEGNRGVLQDYERDYDERVAEARGDDAMPNTAEEWSAIAGILRMSRKQILTYSTLERCFCCIDSTETTVPDDTETNNEQVYYWQFETLGENIDFAPFINQAFLDTIDSEPIQAFINGNLIAYSNIGRIGFVITNIEENQYRIFDVLNVDITETVFDTYYNETLNHQVYISKEYYSYGNIYFKLNPS